MSVKYIKSVAEFGTSYVFNLTANHNKEREKLVLNGHETENFNYLVDNKRFTLS